MKDYPTLDAGLSFKEYISNCRSLIKRRRTDLNQPNSDEKRIIDVNSPYELSPLNPIKYREKVKYGALLIHGLFDCPFSLKDIGRTLQQNGILTRSILLPGHGTVPSDLLHVSYQDWIKAVRYGIETSQKEVEKLFLVGYSTGAALSVYEALQNPRIAGIVLLAPAIKIKGALDIVIAWHRLKKWTTKNKDWMYYESETDYTKYQSIAFNPIFQLSKLTEEISELQEHRLVNCPIFMVMSREDETISSDTAVDFFLKFHHQESQLLLYTSYHHTYSDTRILPRQTEYPDLHINHLSHIGIPFAPSNFHYGQQGDYSYASHIDSKFIYGAYNHIEERAYEMLYKYGFVKYKRRTLTYNPDFDFMTRKITNFILNNN